MKNVQNLINQNGLDDKLNDLFQNICLINGHVCSTIDELNEQLKQSNNYFQSLNQRQIQIYTKSLMDACGAGRHIRITLKKSKNRFNHIPIFTSITDSFMQLYANLQVYLDKILAVPLNLENEFSFYLESTRPMLR
jgi:hypothetical protein